MKRSEKADMRILVAAGNPFVRSLIRMMLRDAGYPQSFDAVSVAEAWSRATTELFDLVIADWNFEDGTARDFLSRLRTPEAGECALIPVIITYSVASKKAVMAAARAGANDILLKPFSQRTLDLHVTGALTEERQYINTGTYSGPAPRDALIRFIESERQRNGNLRRQAAVKQESKPAKTQIDDAIFL